MLTTRLIRLCFSQQASFLGIASRHISGRSQAKIGLAVMEIQVPPTQRYDGRRQGPVLFTVLLKLRTVGERAEVGHEVSFEEQPKTYLKSALVMLITDSCRRRSL